MTPRYCNSFIALFSMKMAFLYNDLITIVMWYDGYGLDFWIIEHTRILNFTSFDPLLLFMSKEIWIRWYWKSIKAYYRMSGEVNGRIRWAWNRTREKLINVSHWFNSNWDWDGKRQFGRWKDLQWNYKVAINLSKVRWK